jgi:hypothetical protein
MRHDAQCTPGALLAWDVKFPGLAAAFGKAQTE